MVPKSTFELSDGPSSARVKQRWQLHSRDTDQKITANTILVSMQHMRHTPGPLGRTYHYLQKKAFRHKTTPLAE